MIKIDVIECREKIRHEFARVARTLGDPGLEGAVIDDLHGDIVSHITKSDRKDDLLRAFFHDKPLGNATAANILCFREYPDEFSGVFASVLLQLEYSSTNYPFAYHYSKAFRPFRGLGWYVLTAVETSESGPEDMPKTASCLCQREVVDVVKNFIDPDPERDYSQFVLETIIVVADYTGSRAAVRSSAALLQELKKSSSRRNLGYNLGITYDELEKIAMRSSKPAIDVSLRARRLVDEAKSGTGFYKDYLS